MVNRRPGTGREGPDGAPDGACLVPCDQDADPAAAHALVLHRDVAGRLVRAWLGLGTGGMLLFVSASVLAGNPHHLPTTALGVAAVGAVLALRGSRVVKQTRRDLLRAAASNALPAARIIP